MLYIAKKLFLLLLFLLLRLRRRKLELLIVSVADLVAREDCGNIY